jgi:hypothetical protein
MTPQVVEESTYKMITPDGGQCSAWAVDKNYLVSAGHCCSEPGWYFVYSSTQRVFAAQVVDYKEVDHTTQVPLDICLLATEAPLPAPLKLADAMPTPETPVFTVGYPNGEFTHSQGVYVGDIDGEYRFDNDYFATAPCDRGASGSPISTQDGVYGVIVRLVVLGDQVLPGDAGCVASPLSQILDIMGEWTEA